MRPGCRDCLVRDEPMFTVGLIMKRATTGGDPAWRFLVGLLAVAAVLVGAFFAARPLVSRSREGRLGRFLANGEAARQRRDYASWWAHLLAAKEINPADPRVLRGIAEHLTHYRLSGGLAYWRALEQLGSLNRSDRLQWTRLALALERTDIARDALVPLHAENSRDPAVLILISELFELDGDLGRARAAANDAAALAPGDALIELRLAALELNGGSPESLARGKASLIALLSGRSAVRADAGFLFLQVAGGRPSDRQLLRQLLRATAESPFEEQVLALGLAAADQPDAAERLAREFVDRQQLQTASPRLTYAAEQLGRLGETRLVLALVPESLAIGDGDLCRLRLGALAAAKNLKDMQRLLAHPDLPLASFARAVFDAGVAQMAGWTNQVGLLWPKAIAACAEQPGALNYLARHAESVGATEVALEAWRVQLADAFLAPKAAVQMLRLANQRRDYLASSVALRRLVQLRPEAWDARLSLAFTQLMLNLPDPETPATLALEPARFVSPDFCQVTRALHELRAGRVDRAVETLELIQSDWAGVPTSWQVVRVAALGQSGQANQARQLAAGLVRQELSAPEMTLVESWLPPRGE